MGKASQIYFRFIRACAAIIKPAKYVQGLEGIDQPCVFISRHRGMQAPIYTMAHMSSFCRPWVLYMFFDRKAFAKQMIDYTLTVRLRWPKWIAKPAGPFFAFFVVPIIVGMRSIPVYRNDPRIRETFRQSLEALEAGDNLMIYPDVEYTSTAEDVGSVYEGFFMLERMYHRKTGRHIPFIPVHPDMEKKEIRYAEPVIFGDGNFNEEKAIARAKLVRELHD